MPRARTIPRHNGKILLHNEQTLAKLEIPEGTDDAGLVAIDRELTDMLTTARQYFYIATGQRLWVDSDEKAGFRWCITDQPLNSSQYPWLRSKCLKLENQIVDRMNKDGIKSALSS